MVVHELKLQWVGVQCPSRHLFKIGCHVLLSVVIQTACLKGLCCLFSCPDVCVHHCLGK